MKQLLWAIVRPAIVAWLQNRALRLPAAKQADLAKRLSVPVEAIGAINDEVVSFVIGQVEAARL